MVPVGTPNLHHRRRLHPYWRVHLHSLRHVTTSIMVTIHILIYVPIPISHPVLIPIANPIGGYIPIPTCIVIPINGDVDGDWCRNGREVADWDRDNDEDGHSDNNGIVDVVSAGCGNEDADGL